VAFVNRNMAPRRYRPSGDELCRRCAAVGACDGAVRDRCRIFGRMPRGNRREHSFPAASRERPPQPRRLGHGDGSARTSGHGGLLLSARASSRARVVYSGIFAGVLLFVLLGLSPAPGVDILAHAGGFLTGAMIGLIMTRVKFQPPWLDFLNGLCGAVLCGLSWWFALR
jgi:hypothetical protein